MSAEVSFTKRAAAELSRCFNGITVSRQASSKSSSSSSSSSPNIASNDGTTVSPSSSPAKPTSTSNNVSNHITIFNNNCVDSKSSSTTSTSTTTTTTNTSSSSRKSSTSSSHRRNSNPAYSIIDNNSTENNNNNNSNTNSPVHHRNNCYGEKHQSKQQQLNSSSTIHNNHHTHPHHLQQNSTNNHNNNCQLDNSVNKSGSSLNDSPHQTAKIGGTPSRQKRPSRSGPPPKAPPKTNSARRKNYQLNLNRPRTLAELFRNEQFLHRLFTFVTPIERCTLVQVCKTWCHVLYDDSKFWDNLTFVIYYNEFRQFTNNNDNDNSGDDSGGGSTEEKTLLLTKADSEPGETNNSTATGSDKPNDPLVLLQRENQLSRALQQKQETTTNNNNNDELNQNHKNSRTVGKQSIHCVNDNENGFSSILLYSNGECGGVCEQNVVNVASVVNAASKNSPNWQQSLIGSSASLSSSSLPPTSMPSKGENAFYAKMLMMTAANNANNNNSATLNKIQYPTLALLDKSDFPTRLFCSLKIRRFGSICLHGANDSDLIELATQVTLNSIDTISDLCIRHSTITDKGIEVLLASLARSLQSFELIGCNELSDSGLWTGLVPKLTSLTIQDCINISDETIAAICQLLPALSTLNIQAYHVTDASMAYFSTSMLRETLRVLVLQHCWEITNQGVANLAHSLPNLTSLSLSGCSKVTDDAIEIVAEQLRSLVTLDLSWCPRISDAALEYIACDLAETLQNLVLDRCLHITDIGLGYIATMAHLEQLSVRWCPQVRDFGIQTLVSLRTLKSLSIAGCNHITITGMSFLIRMQQLHELELTNCPAASKDLIKYLFENMPKSCTIIH